MVESPRQIQEKVVQILRSRCRVEGEILPESRLAADLKLDSVGILTMALEIENLYGMNLGDEPDSPPETVEDVVALISVRLRERT